MKGLELRMMLELGLPRHQRAVTNRLLALLVLILSWLRGIVAVETRDCYGPDSILHDHLYACYPDRGTSHCCAHSDFCLDNDACLDSEGDNDFVLQGCTDQNWGPGCGNYCPSFNGYDGNIHLSFCGANNYCCGDETHDCCNSTDPSTFFALLPFTTVFKAPEALATPATGNAAEAATNNTTTPSDSPNSSSSGISPVAIALPLGALGTGAIVLVAWFLIHRRAHKNEQDKHDGASSVELSDTPPGSGILIKTELETETEVAPAAWSTPVPVPVPVPVHCEPGPVAARYPKSDDEDEDESDDEERASSTWVGLGLAVPDPAVPDPAAPVHGDPARRRGSPSWPLYSHPADALPASPPSFYRAGLASSIRAELSAERLSPKIINVTLPRAVAGSERAGGPMRG